MTPTIRFQVLPHGEGLALPSYQTPGAAGMDLRAAIEEGLMVEPGQRHAVPTGLRIAIPLGFEGQVRARSGLAFRHGLGMPNSPGTIDADYRGELKVLVINFGHETVEITRGMRIAQLVICPVAQARVEAVPELDATDRGEAGFGSTGAH